MQIDRLGNQRSCAGVAESSKEPEEIKLFECDGKPIDEDNTRIVCLPSRLFLHVPLVIMKLASPVWRAALNDQSNVDEQIIEITASPGAVRTLFELLATHHGSNRAQRCWGIVDAQF